MKTRYVSDDGKERPYRCDVCSRCYTSAGNLTVHKRSHLTTKRFACPICHKGFTRKLSRNQHIENQHLKRQSVDAEPLLQPLKDADKHRRNSTGSWELTVALETLRMGAQRGRRARKPSPDVDVLSQAAKDHCQQRQGPILKRFECPEAGCGRKFSAKRSLIRHTQTSHVVARRRDSLAILSDDLAHTSHAGDEFNPFKIVVTGPGPKAALCAPLDAPSGSQQSRAGAGAVGLPVFRDLPVPPGSTSGAFRPRPRSNSTPDALGLGLFRLVRDESAPDPKLSRAYGTTGRILPPDDAGRAGILAAVPAEPGVSASAGSGGPCRGPGLYPSAMIVPIPVPRASLGSARGLEEVPPLHPVPRASSVTEDHPLCHPQPPLAPLDPHEPPEVLPQPKMPPQLVHSDVAECVSDPAACPSPRACSATVEAERDTTHAQCATSSALPPVSLARVNYCSVRMDELLHPHWLHPPRGPGDVSDTDSVGSDCSLSQSDSPIHLDPTFNIPAVSTMHISSPELSQCSVQDPAPHNSSRDPTDRGPSWGAPPPRHTAPVAGTTGQQKLSTALFGRVESSPPCTDGFDAHAGLVRSILLRPWAEELLAPTPSQPLRDASQDPMLPVSP